MSNEKKMTKPEHMKKIIAHLTDRYINIKKKDNTIDFIKLQDNQLFHAIEDQMDLSVQIMREEMYLAKLNSQLNELLKVAVIDNKTQNKYSLSNAEENVFINASGDILRTKLEIENQKAYIKFIKSQLDFLVFYDKKVQTFLDIEKTKIELGHYDQATMKLPE